MRDLRLDLASSRAEAIDASPSVRAYEDVCLRREDVVQIFTRAGMERHPAHAPRAAAVRRPRRDTANLTLAEAMAILIFDRSGRLDRPASKDAWQRLHRRQGYLKGWLGGSFLEDTRQKIDEKGREIVELLRRGQVEAFGRWRSGDGDSPPGAMQPIGYPFLAEPLWVEPQTDKIWTEPWNPLDAGYVDVVLNRAQLLEAIGAKTNVRQPASSESARGSTDRRYAKAQLREWWRKYVAQHLEAGTIPSREEDWNAAKAAVSRHIPREQVRELRRTEAPEEWTKKGRRKNWRELNRPPICQF